MRYVTHQFAHLETLERARRWLVGAGFDVSRIEVHARGIPTLAVAVEAGETAEAAFVIDAAELADPQGNPSFWDLARQPQVILQAEKPLSTSLDVPVEGRFVVGWKPLDTEREVVQTTTDERLREGYVERGV